MSDFADRLRAQLAQKNDDARAETVRKEEEQKAALERFHQADAAGAALAEEVFAPLFEELNEIMDAQNVLREGRVRCERPGHYRSDAGRQAVSYRGVARRRERQYYEVRVSVDVSRLSSIELGAACLTYPGGAASRSNVPVPPTVLLELPPLTIATSGTDRAAVREWCEDALKRCAEVLLEANYIPGRAPAPIAPPVYSCIDVPAMA